jgi:hypothetical protein
MKGIMKTGCCISALGNVWTSLRPNRSGIYRTQENANETRSFTSGGGSRDQYVPGDNGIDLAVSALEISVAHDRRAAVPGAGDINHEIYQIGAGFSLMGTSLALLVVARTTFSVFALVGLLALRWEPPAEFLENER